MNWPKNTQLLSSCVGLNLELSPAKFALFHVAHVHGHGHGMRALKYLTEAAQQAQNSP